MSREFGNLEFGSVLVIVWEYLGERKIVKSLISNIIRQRNYFIVSQTIVKIFENFIIFLKIQI